MPDCCLLVALRCYSMQRVVFSLRSHFCIKWEPRVSLRNFGCISLQRPGWLHGGCQCPASTPRSLAHLSESKPRPSLIALHRHLSKSSPSRCICTPCCFRLRRRTFLLTRRSIPPLQSCIPYSVRRCSSCLQMSRHRRAAASTRSL